MSRTSIAYFEPLLHKTSSPLEQTQNGFWVLWHFSMGVLDCLLISVGN
jgi:hypothetical protein